MESDRHVSLIQSPGKDQSLKRRQFIGKMLKIGILVSAVSPVPIRRFSVDKILENGSNQFVHSVHTAKKSAHIHTVNAPKILSIYNTHTGESLRDCVFHHQGALLPDAMGELNKLFRDHRANTSHTIDPKLFLLIHAITAKLETKKTIHLVSGYRSHESNAKLRQESFGVAKTSLHTKGMAADIYIEGIPNARLQKIALAHKGGGVGRYQHFVHVDTGRIRRWGLLPVKC